MKKILLFFIVIINLISFSFFNFANAVKTVPITGCGTNFATSTFLIVNNTIGSGGSCPATGEEIAIPTGNTLSLSETASGAVSISNPISGAGTLSVFGSSTALTLTGSNTLTGTIQVSADLTLTNSSGYSSASVSTVEIRGSSSILKLGAHDIFGSYMSTSPSIDFATTGGTLSNLSNWFNHIGDVTLADGAIITTDGNHSSGDTTVAGLNLDGDITLGDNSTANLNADNGGTYGLGTGSDTGPDREFTVGSNSTLNINAPLVNGQGGSSGWPTNQPDASITKLGAGTLVLGDANTYSGSTTIDVGTLRVDGTLSDSSAITINANGTYDVNNSDTVASIEGSGIIDIASSTTLTAGDANDKEFSGVIQGAGTLNKTGSSTLTISGTSNSITGTLRVSQGNVTITGKLASIDEIRIENSSSTVTLNGGDVFGNHTSPSPSIVFTAGGTLSDDNYRFNHIGAITLVDGATITTNSNQTDADGVTVIAGLNLDGDITLGDNSTANFNATNGGTYGLGTGSDTDTNRNFTVGSNSTLNINAPLVNGQGESSDTWPQNQPDASITKLGAGTLVLGGVTQLANTYSGSTTIDDGTLRVNGTLSDSSAITINANGTYDVNNSDTVASIEGSGIIDIASSTTLTAGDANDKEFSGVIQGAGNFSKSGSGTLTLSGTNTYTGSTTINAGTISVASSANLGATPGSADADNIIFNGGTLNTTADFTLGTNKGITMTGAGTIDTDASTTLTYGGVITGTGALTKAGSGTLTLSGTNTYTGSTTINAGTISVASSANLGATPGLEDADNIIFNGGTLNTTADFTLGTNKGITMTGAGTIDTDASTTLTYGGVITGTGALTKAGSGTLTLSGTNTYEGSTTINAGTISVASSDNLGDADTGNIIFAGGTLLYTGSNTQIIGVNKGVTISSDSTVDVDLSSGELRFAGSISGSANLTKTGAGNFRFTNSDNSFSGALIINQGEVSLTQGTANAYRFDVTVQDDANLSLSRASFNTNNTITVESGGAVNLYGGTGGGRDFTGNFNIAGTGNTNGSVNVTASAITTTGDPDTLVQILGTVTLSADASVLYNGNNTIISGGKLQFGDHEDGTTTTAVNLGNNTLTLMDKNSSNAAAKRVYEFFDEVTGTGTLDISQYAEADFTNAEGSLADTVNIDVDGTLKLDTSDTVASLQGSGEVNISSGTFTVNQSSTTSYSGIISGAGNFSKSGSGTLTLSGTNTYTGSTTINAGTIDVSGQLNSGNYAGAIANSGTFTFSSDSDQILSGDISGTGALTKSGSSTLTLSGTNTYTGSTTVSDGTLQLTGSLNNLTAVTVNSGASLDLQASQTIASLDLDGSITRSAGTSTLTVSGTSDLGGNVTTTGTQTYTDATTLSAANTLTTTNSNITFSNTVNSDGTTRNLTINAGTGTTQFAGIVGGTNGVGDIDITGALDLNAAISNASSLSVSGTSNIGADVTTTGTQGYSGTTTLSGGDRTLTGSTVTLAAVTGGSNALTVTGNLDLGGAVTGVKNMSVSGTSNIGADVTTTGTQGYSGTTTLSGGDRTLTGSTINFGSTVDGGGNNIIIAGNAGNAVNAVIGGEITNTAALSVQGEGSTSNIGADITTAGVQFLGNATLSGTGDRTVTSTGGDNITFYGITGDSKGLTVDGGFNLINDATGLASLSVTRVSTLAANVTSTGVQNYQSATTLGANNTLTTTNSNIIFGGAVETDGNSRNLTINTGAGTTQFAGVVGDTTTIGAIDINGSLDLDAAIANAASLDVSGTSNIGANVTTTGTQSYSGTTTLFGGDRTLTGSTITMAAVTGTGSHDLTVTGNLDLDGAVTDVVELDITGTSNLGANITTTGTQTYTGATTLSAANTLTTTDSNITFSNTVNSDGTTRNLTINAGTGTTQFAGIVGGTNGVGDIDITGALDLNAAISNASSLSVSGTSNIGANVTTTGTQSYSGTTTVSASSTLNGTEITAAAAVLNNNLNVTNSSSSSFTGAISGTGNLTKAGSGTLTLSGTNSYTGDTTISAGTLTVSGTLSNSTAVSVASGAIYDVDATDTIASVDGAGTVDIASSTTLTTGDTNDQELSGTVSGAGSLTKAGSGILTLSGTNSYSGNTAILAGTLLVTSQLGEGTYAGNISNSGDFDINSSSDQTLSGVISGLGTINKSGTGELTLTGANTFNGTINVAGGTLFAGTSSDGSNDITLGDIVVKGGTLGGGGVIGGDVSFTTTGGTLAPGNSIGTLTVSGDLTLTADDTTEIEFNASSADKIVVNGNTTIAGTISLFPENTTYSDVSLTIVDASAGGTFSGTFATETMNNQSNLNGATWDIVYDTVGKTVKLDLTEAASSSKSIKDTTTINKFKNVATIFDNATTGQFKEIKDVLNSATVNSVNTELGKLKGTVLATTFTQPTLNHNNFNRALSSVTSSNVNTSLVSSFTSSSNELTLASLQDAGLYGDKKNFNEYFDYSDTSVLGFVKNNKNRSIFNDFQSEDSATFIRTYGTTADRDNINSNYTGYDSETTGILFGQQFKNDEETFTGYSYGFTGTDTDYKNNYGESKTYSVHASLFKQYDKKDHGLNLISGMYVSKTESERNVSVFGTSVNDKYVSDYWDVGVNQEVQYIKKYKFGEVSVSPSAKLNSTYVFKSDTEETGGELALNVDNENLFIVKPELGISIGVDLSKKENINNELSLAMFASQDHFIDGTTSNARYSSGSSFNVDLPRDQETYYSLGLGYNFLNKETDTSLMANAFLMQNEESDMNSNIFSLTFRKLFGDFAKGNVPPVIAKKPENDQEVIKEASPKDKNSIKKVEKTLEEFEENIEIVLKESPTEQEVAKVYESISNNSKIKRQLTLNDVYNNLSANCYAIENKLVHLVNYYDKQQLYKILDKCNKLSDPKIHLIANRLHQIQLDETTAYQKIYTKYLRILSYVPFVTFVAFIILAYEFIRRYIINHFRAKNTV